MSWTNLAYRLRRAGNVEIYFDSCSDVKLAKYLVRLIGMHTSMFSDSDSLLQVIIKRLDRNGKCGHIVDNLLKEKNNGHAKNNWSTSNTR